jgi:hypothetical protein
MASLARSRPGALPYHMPSTPSYLPVPITLATCDPHTAVAPSSSFNPGTNRTSSSVRTARCWPITASRPPTGEPGYPEISPAVRSPARRSARRWSMIVRTIACIPPIAMSPRSAAKRSRSSNVVTVMSPVWREME